MISLQDAKDMIGDECIVDFHTGDETLAYDDATKVIEDIYKSIGECCKCAHFEERGDYGICTKLRDTDQALWVNIEVDNDWYCKDFMEGRDGKKD